MTGKIPDAVGSFGILAEVGPMGLIAHETPNPFRIAGNDIRPKGQVLIDLLT